MDLGYLSSLRAYAAAVLALDRLTASELEEAEREVARTRREFERLRAGGSISVLADLAMCCKQGAILLAEYHEAAVEVSFAVANLAEASGSSPHADYEVLSILKEQARERLQAASAVYKHHIAENGCAGIKERTAGAS